MYSTGDHSCPVAAFEKYLSIVRGLASWRKILFNPSGRKNSLVPGKSITIKKLN